MAVSRMNLRMFPLRASPMTAGLLSGLFCLAGSAFAASPVPLSAEILGQVRNSGGVAQMGAAVSLYNRYDELVRKGLTNEQGRFVFDALVPDLYSIRVVLASFVPAERRNISVLPNTENRLDISLASVLSTVELAPPSAPGTLMTDDWKWVLRSSQSTRPVLRFLPDSGPSSSSSRSILTAFSNTTGVVKLSAGDGESFTNGGQQDLGTAFALATSLAGSGRVQFSEHPPRRPPAPPTPPPPPPGGPPPAGPARAAARPARPPPGSQCGIAAVPREPPGERCRARPSGRASARDGPGRRPRSPRSMPTCSVTAGPRANHRPPRAAERTGRLRREARRSSRSP